MYRQYVSTQEALDLILEDIPKPRIEVVSLDKANGRVLAEKVIATCPIPSFDRSPYDGYAVRYEDVVSATPESPVSLCVIEEIPAGHTPQKALLSGQASRIMTGAPIPEGADTIIKFEDTDLTRDTNQHFIGDNQEIRILRIPNAPINYARVGEDMDVGDILLDVGRVIDPAAVAVLATFGYNFIKVYMKPTAIVISSGDELIAVDQPLAYGKIRNSNAASIAAQMQNWGVKATIGGIANDNLEELANLLLSALQEHEIVITTGGVSAGDYDVMKEVFQAIGAEILFWRVAMRPGTPMVVAKWGDRIIFGLSGNPSAAYVSCELFVRAYIYKLQHHEDFWRVPHKGRLLESLKSANQDRFLRAVASLNIEGQLEARPLPKQKSGILVNLLTTNALIYVPAGNNNWEAGSIVDVILLKPPKGYSKNGEW